MTYVKTHVFLARAKYTTVYDSKRQRWAILVADTTLCSCAISLNFQKLNMAPNKTSAKRKNKAPTEGTTTEQERCASPTLAELSQSLEERAHDKESTSNDEPTQEPSPSLVLQNPEALPRDLVQEMRFMVAEFREQKKEHANQMLEMSARLAATPKSDLQWRKEGNRKQYEVMKDLLIHVHQVIAFNKIKDSNQVAFHGGELLKMINERVKLLRIADSSTHGWSTVAEYQANPIAEDEKDDLKLKRAEKAAQDKYELKEKDKKAKQSRFQPYGQSNQWNSNRNNTDHQNQDYKAYGGYKNNNPYRPSSVAPEKAPPKRNVNNDLCFNCGSRGHWAHACPEKQQQKVEK